MATEAEIQEVQFMLDGSAGTAGWDENRIGDQLDAGLSPNEIAARYWEWKVNNSVSLANVSESGSSRSLGQVFDHIKERAAYYRKRADDEVVETETDNSAFSRPITRV